MTNLITTLHPKFRQNDFIHILVRLFSGASITDMDVETDEEQLVFQAAKDPQAFDELYRKYVNRVYAYHLVRTANREEAEDLTSLTFLAALEGIKGYRHQSCFPVWLFGIARRKLIDHYRQSNRPLPDTTDKPSVDLEDYVDRRLRLKQVNHALASIDPDRVEALCLRFFGQLNTIEISHLLSKSEGAVRNLVYRALQDLRGKLAVVEDVEEK